MTPGARVQAAIEVLDAIAAGSAAEAALLRWSRGSRFAGAKDRAAVRDHVFDVLRQRRSLAALGGGEGGRCLMLGLVRATGQDADQIFNGLGHAPGALSEQERMAGHPATGAAALDLPDWLLPQWQASLGAQAVEVADTLRWRAPVMLRVNLARADRAAVQAALAAEGIVTEPAGIAATALRVLSGARGVARSAAYLDGRVELQDGASQALVAALLPVSGSVLDYCAGGGGKVLALAAQCPARLYAHDAAPARMADLPERAARAGARIALLPPGDAGRHAPYDMVLADVPCSGSGAWRRAPEGKWLLTPARLDDLTATQDGILDDVAPLVASGGRLAYATCSVLRDENEARIAAFVARRPGWQVLAQQRWLPGPEGDGFFLGILAKP